MDVDRRRRDPFDMLFDSPFMRYRTEERFIETKPLTLTVLPLPEEGKPETFRGAVGDFDMNVSLDRTDVKTNEALTMTVRFSGTGNIKLLDKPDFKAPPEFESYDPKETVKINRSGNLISGTKTYEYVLIPRVPGRTVIPPITFTYFDPRSKSYKTVTKGGFEVEVQKGESTVTTSLPGISKSEVKLLGEDINYLKPPGHLLRIGSPYRIPAGYWMGMMLPPVLLLLIWWMARLLGAPSMKARRRSRLIYARAKKDLQAVSKTAGTGDPYGEIHRILLKYLGQKLDLPASGLKEEEVLERLKKRRIPDDLLTDLREIFEECNQARFAPAGADPSLQHRLIKRSHRTLDALETRLGIRSGKNAKIAASVTLFALWTFLAVGSAQSQNPSPRQAEELYRNGDYEKAAEVYKKILQEGWHNGELYYNLGNCYYKSGNYGKAILNYERARRFLGNDADLEKNLKLANLHITDRIEPLPRIILIRAFETIAGLFSVRQWAVVFIAFEWLLFITILGLNTVRRFNLRRMLAKGFVLFSVLTVISGGFFLEQKIEKDHRVEGIVLTDRVEVRSAPESGATELFTLHEGAKVRILRTVADWAEIRLADGKDGWMPLSAFEVI
jgi:tetratricopeptide (TPR) repeat protein